MNFKNEIQIRGMKQKYFADKIQISEARLSMYLKGTRNMPDKIRNDLKMALELIPVPK